MAPTAHEKAISDMDQITMQIELLETVFADHPNVPLGEVEVANYMAEIEEARKQIGPALQKILHSAPAGTDMDPIKATYFSTTCRASRIYSKFHGLKMSFPPPAIPSSSGAAAPPPGPSHKIKLPALELPKFDGNLESWVPFKDLFITAVHNSSLSKVEKLTHLKASLTGEASRLIRSLALSETNYDIAWQTLQDRYTNNRELLFALLKRLLNQPILSASSATGLRSLVDNTKEVIRSLETMAIPTEHWDAILLYLLFTKLDSTSRELWEHSLPDTNVPKLDKMYDFIEQRSRALAANSAVQPFRHHAKIQQHPKSHHNAAHSKSCKLGCDTQHPLYKCPRFQAFTPKERQDNVNRLNLCRNCLWSGHHLNACTSTFTCRICAKMHHTLLHDNSKPGGNPQNQHENSSQQPPQTHHAAVHPIVSTGILATASVIVSSTTDQKPHRALIDGGSTNTQIMKRTARRLRLPLIPVNIPMTGPGEVDCGTVSHVTTLQFSPWFDPSIQLTTTALVVDKISGSIPSTQLQHDKWPHLMGLQLADPAYHKPGEVELLFGTDVVWNILQQGKVEGQPGQPIGTKTSLGWLVAGANQPSCSSAHVRTFTITANLEADLRRFINQEESVDEKPNMTSEEKLCEKHFADTHRRDATGRFHVRLPFKPAAATLGSSRVTAVRRFLSLEKRYNTTNIKDAERVKAVQQQWESYKDFMAEYLRLGHMEPVPMNEVHSPDTYYIPHHAVIKESSTTTKLRVVFDASASSTSGVSLNQCLMVGPQLQDGIWEVKLRFRLWPYAFTADIEKMFRMIAMSKPDTDYQRIVFRASEDEPIQDYRLTTVTYGTAPASYLAVKCLTQLAKDEEHRYPKGAQLARKQYYMDDLAGSRPTKADAMESILQSIDLCKAGGMSLRKWTTNNDELTDIIPAELRETSSLVEVCADATVKTLGIFWNPKADHYQFKIVQPDVPPGTKRAILAEIARIYDPLGLLAPAIVVCKIFLQELWKTKHDWDDELPQELKDKWTTIRTSVRDLERLTIPRCVIPHPPLRIYLIGCSDASVKAISACVYIAVEYDDGTRSSRLLTSKANVAPLKPVTLPRLELNAAVLLAKLLRDTRTALELDLFDVRAFTDSTITLNWIQSEATRWPTYVRNRVQTIQDCVGPQHWYHIPGERNPADCASRGLSAEELINHDLWWNGVPDFFHPTATVPILPESQSPENEAHIQCHIAQPIELPEFITKFASFRRLKRVVAYILRFKQLTQSKPLRVKGPLSLAEITTAHTCIMKIIQASSFQLEYSILQGKLPLPKTHRFAKLAPFIGRDGLIRVGGRLRNANVSYDRKHPILLPNNHHITRSIITDSHGTFFHSGPKATLAALQHKYWITNGLDTVKAVLRKCVTCTRQRAEVMQQLMGDLPHHRVNEAAPFTKTGVDYAGPFTIKPMVRSKVTLKCWLAVFVCLTTRAIHIEIVSSLSTECFLAALRRFVSRRGRPTDIHSDCGTNFRGADNVLKDFFTLTRQAAVQDECTTQGIAWHFIPPGAPHFGGLWEAGVKSIKLHLIKVMGPNSLTYEEMLTLVTQIEAILNSRPLIAASSDPNDLEALTPGHFLIGRPLTAVAEPDVSDSKVTTLQRWKLLQQQQQRFWKRWSAEYLARLQQRPKWMKSCTNLEVGQLVTIKNENLPPMQWQLGRVQEIHPGKDGHVRVATIWIGKSSIKRPISKLVLLPIS